MDNLNINIMDVMDKEEVKELFQQAVIELAREKLDQWMRSTHGVSNMAVWFVSAFAQEAADQYKDEILSKVKERVYDPKTYNMLEYGELREAMNKAVKDNYSIVEENVKERLTIEKSYDDLSYKIGHAITDKLFKMIAKEEA